MATNWPTVRNLLLVPSGIRRGRLKATKSEIDEGGEEEQGEYAQEGVDKDEGEDVVQSAG